VDAGDFTSGLDHFIKYGKYDGHNPYPAVENVDPDPDGETYTLTDDVESIDGTAGSDTFIAGLTGAGNTTLNAGDALDGKGGTDTLKITGDANVDNFLLADISNIQKVYATLDNAATGNLDVSTNSDVEEAWISKGTIAGTPTFTLLKAQTAGIAGKVAGAAAATFAFDDATAAAGDEATLALEDADLAAGASVTINDIETLNIVAGGSTNDIVTLDTDSVTKLVVTGAGSFTAADAGNGATLKTIDASDNTGGVTLDITGLSTATQDHTITGGDGDDTIVTLWAQLDKDDTINLGAGDEDALIFGDSATITAATQQTKLSNVSNVEVLGVSGTTLTADADLLDTSIETFLITSAGAVAALTNVTEGTTLVAKADAAATAFGASTIDTKLGANTINVDLEGSKTQVADFTAGLTITGSTTVNIDSSGTAGAGANLLKLTAPANNTLNITGSQDLTLETLNAPTSTGLTIDGSDFTGDLKVGGTAQADVIEGGDGDDLIVGSVTTLANLTTPNVSGAVASGADTLTGNGGTNTFGFAASSLGKTNMSTITDFSVGDKLMIGLNAGSGSFVGTAIDVSGAANLDAAIGLADNTASNVAWFNYDSNTYVVAAGATTGVITDDTIIKLEGTLDLSDSTLATAATGDTLTFA
jgi:hypothetical protein